MGFATVMLRSRVRIAFLNPAAATAWLIAFLVGAFGGALPAGFHQGGAGIGLGAAWGLNALTAVLPLLATYLVVAQASARFRTSVDQELFLAHVPQSSTFALDIVVGMLLAASLIVPATIAGTIVGLADAIHLGTAWMTSFDPLAVIRAGVVALAMATIGTCATLVARSATGAYALIIGWLLIALIAVRSAGTQFVWDALSVLPSAPLTILGSRLAANSGLRPELYLAALASFCWLIGLIWATQHRLQYRAPRSGARR